MNVLSVAFLAFAMSTDAFVAALGKGAALSKPRFSEAVKIGVIFGVIEASTPVLGWVLGSSAVSYISAWGHWASFVLLCGLGLLMIRNGRCAPLAPPIKAAGHSFWKLAATGVATSLDALAAGVSLALINVDIVPIAVAIGFATFCMVTLGIMLGRVLTQVVGRHSEVLGGCILIGIGVTILGAHSGGLDHW